MRNLAVILLTAIAAGSAGAFLLLRGDGSKPVERQNQSQPAYPAPAVDASAAWPVYRGSCRLDGTADGRLGLVPRRIWQFQAGGYDNRSAPVISGGLVLYSNMEGKVFAIKLIDGSVAWRQDIGSDVTASPCIIGDTVLVSRDDGGTNTTLFCLAMKDGEILWQKKTGKIETSANAGVFGTPPEGKILICAVNGEVSVADAKSGRQIWLCESKRYIDPVVAVYHRLKGYTGKLVEKNARRLGITWQYDDFNDGNIVFHILAAPAFDGDLMAVSSCDGMALEVYSISEGVRKIRIDLDEYAPSSAAMSGTEAYIRGIGSDKSMAGDLGTSGARNDATASATKSPTTRGAATRSAADSRNYDEQNGGKLFRLDCSSGKVVWAKALPGTMFYNSPALAEGRIIVGANDSCLRCLSRADGSEIWVYHAFGEINCGSAVCDGKVVFGDDAGWLYMLSLTDGKKIWSYELGAAVMGSPAVAGGWIVAACRDGRLTAFYADPEKK